MKPRRTIYSNKCLDLVGENEDHSLWVRADTDADGYFIQESVWVPTDKERKAIADGQNIELTVWAGQHPPVALEVTDVQIGKMPV